MKQTLLFFGSTGAWTQGLHLEPLHQPFFCDEFFSDRVSWTIWFGLASNQDPLDCSLLSSKDYRHLYWLLCIFLSFSITMKSLIIESQSLSQNLNDLEEEVVKSSMFLLTYSNYTFKLKEHVLWINSWLHIFWNTFQILKRNFFH
jgi:hypothetical protein